MFSKLNKKHYLIALSVILILSAAGFAYYKMVYIPAQAANTAKLASQTIQTAVVQQGDIIIYARGTGTLIARDEINLGFGAGGPISELNVRIGDKVHKGDVLAVQGNREKLEAAVVADEISMLNAINALKYLEENSAMVAAQAQLDLANATVALNKAENQWWSIQKGNRATPIMFTKAEATLVLAQYRLDQATIAYNATLEQPLWDPNRAQAQLDLTAAQLSYNSALRVLNWYKGQPTKSEQEKLDAAVALAKANLALAQSKLDKVKNGPDPDQVSLAKLQVASAEANLALSKRNLDLSRIVALMDGTILSVTAKVGNDVSTPFISMADLSQRYLTISLDGTDIDKIAPDYKVEVIFDALPNQIFKGRVLQIDPILYAPTGEKITTQIPGQITVIKGLVSLDESAITAINNLPLGMTATVDVIGGQAQGVIIVPIEALHEQSPGQYAVFVMENGGQKLRPVVVGLMDITYAEIKSGLKVGEIIITSLMAIK
ncbi:MAG: hypothetical protein C0410_03610 [Anaerolinea sp.]|nr:hypothetical protein [Anaerolinea sp.]